MQVLPSTHPNDFSDGSNTNGKKKATDSKLETTIQSEFPNYELRITNYQRLLIPKEWLQQEFKFTPSFP
ncbi:MAG: hypothetical protein HWQ43_18960 [Nostoc sp. JL31]|uniref:hypothetical protein n=1 Tax=Nostoc sp. JL31 TaxID=2815395 RepID=UPI0025F4FEA2|nr:hypothetical protein [Nostoc sp. JL31]MBN3891135.1 hypothetical protein [Nostoc sp. JL31]